MPRPRAGQDFNISQLEQMLQERRSKITKLDRERQRILKKLDAVDAQIRELGGDGRSRGGGGGAGRVRNEKSLIETMAEVLAKQGGPMKVADIADAVLATGYKTNSANFRGIVNQTLIKDRQFNQASRGMYQLKK